MNGFDNQANDESPSLEGYMLAEVVFNDDPSRKQRVKVRIPGLLEGPEETLPWVGPLVASDFGITTTAYSINVPAIGSTLAVKFQEGDLNHGVYRSSLHTARTELGSEHTTNYPFRRGWKDPAGNVLFIDSTPSATDVEFRHNSGTFFHVNDDGSVNVEAVKDIHIKAPKIYLN